MCFTVSSFQLNSAVNVLFHPIISVLCNEESLLLCCNQECFHLVSVMAFLFLLRSVEILSQHRIITFCNPSLSFSQFLGLYFLYNSHKFVFPFFFFLLLWSCFLAILVALPSIFILHCQPLELFQDLYGIDHFTPYSTCTTFTILIYWVYISRFSGNSDKFRSSYFQNPQLMKVGPQITVAII